MSLTYKDYRLFRNNPHMFGYYLGYKDLIPLHSEWVKDAWLSDTPSMQAHRNSYKTTSILILGFVWYNIFIDQEATCLIIRKAQQEAWKIIKAIKAHFLSKNVQYLLEQFELLNPGENMKTDNWSNGSITLKTKKTVSPEGSLDCIGMGGAITGAHYDKIFPDDIITLKDRTSKAERESTKDYIRELRNIIKEGGKIFYSGTPWHKNDGWEIIPEPKKYPIGTIPIKGYISDKLEEKKRDLKAGTTSSLYCANYDLKHIADEDKLFPEPIYAKWPTDTVKIVAWIDPAYSGKNTTSLSILAKSKQGLWYARGYTWIKNIVDIYGEIVNKMKRHNVGTVYIETNADKGMSKRDLQQLWPATIGRNESKNKHMKIVSYLKQHWEKIHFYENIDDEYMNQIMDYMEGEEPDDAPDGLAALMREMGFSGSTSGPVQVVGW